MEADKDQAIRDIRVDFSRETTDEEVDRMLQSEREMQEIQEADTGTCNLKVGFSGNFEK